MKSNSILIILCILILSAIITSCNNNSQNTKSKSQTQSSKSDGQETIDGAYTYNDNSAELKITISGSYWSGMTVMLSGMGSGYDNHNTQYDNGIVKGNDLYESSGLVKIGYVSGNSLTTSIGGQSVTLHKN